MTRPAGLFADRGDDDRIHLTDAWPAANVSRVVAVGRERSDVVEFPARVLRVPGAVHGAAGEGCEERQYKVAYPALTALLGLWSISVGLGKSLSGSGKFGRGDRI
jgi:hypothetical protein